MPYLFGFLFWITCFLVSFNHCSAAMQNANDIDDITVNSTVQSDISLPSLPESNNQSETKSKKKKIKTIGAICGAAAGISALILAEEIIRRGLRHPTASDTGNGYTPPQTKLPSKEETVMRNFFAPNANMTVLQETPDLNTALTYENMNFKIRNNTTDLSIDQYGWISPLDYAAIKMKPSIAAFLIANGASVNGFMPKRNNTYMPPIDCLTRYSGGSKMIFNSKNEYNKYLNTVIFLALLGGYNHNLQPISTYYTPENKLKLNATPNELTALLDENGKILNSTKSQKESAFKQMQNTTGNISGNNYAILWAAFTLAGENCIHFLLKQKDAFSLNDFGLETDISNFVENIRNFITTNFGKYYGARTDLICNVVVKIFLNLKNADNKRPLDLATEFGLTELAGYLESVGAVSGNEIVKFSQEEYAALDAISE